MLLATRLVGMVIVGWLWLWSPAFAADAASPENSLIKLTDDVFLFRHRFHQALVITTPNGVIVTDPIEPDAATWLKTAIRTLTDQPVRYVVYSHHHDDHISGGLVFADTAVFISHAAARPKILQAADPHTPVPDLTFTDRMAIDLGGKHVELIYTGKNHSDNSLVVLLPNERLLFAVDFIPVETLAYRGLPDAYPDDWIASLKQVEQLEFDTLVPGHGKIGRKDHVRLFREYLEDLRAAVLEQVKQGATLEEAKNAVQLPKYERWQRYNEWLPENVGGMYRYLTQQLPSR